MTTKVSTHTKHKNNFKIFLLECIKNGFKYYLIQIFISFKAEINQ